VFWFHLRCAACSRPESLLAVLEQGQAAVPESAQLEAVAREGIAQPRLSRILRAERATSGRARCRYCRELIEQGAWRLALQMFEEGRFNSMGTIHASCAVHYFGAEPALLRLTLPSNQLGSDELAQVLSTMREGASRPIQPGLAKATEPERESSRKSS
jgi:hypothetical protein